jgi:hypothetical protein
MFLFQETGYSLKSITSVGEVLKGNLILLVTYLPRDRAAPAAANPSIR